MEIFLFLVGDDWFPDVGEYICQAENRFGMVKVSASLKVLSNPNRPHSNFEENEMKDYQNQYHRFVKSKFKKWKWFSEC